MNTQSVRIRAVRINGLRHFELYVFGVFSGLFVSRPAAMEAASRWDEVFAGVVRQSATNRRAA